MKYARLYIYSCSRKHEEEKSRPGRCRQYVACPRRNEQERPERTAGGQKQGSTRAVFYRQFKSSAMKGEERCFQFLSFISDLACLVHEQPGSWRAKFTVRVNFLMTACFLTLVLQACWHIPNLSPASAVQGRPSDRPTGAFSAFLSWARETSPSADAWRRGRKTVPPCFLNFHRCTEELRTDTER